MLLLNNFLVFLCTAIVVFSFKPINHEIAKTYDVVLNDTSTMTAKGHAEWANYVHMRSLKNGKDRKVDKLLGAGTWQVTGPKSYRISVNNHTMHRMKDDRDVVSIEQVMPYEPTPNDYAVKLKKGVRDAATVTAWANGVHLMISGNDTSDSYHGILKTGFLSKGRWCFVGSFSSETVTRIKNHPQVDSVGQWQGGLSCVEPGYAL